MDGKLQLQLQLQVRSAVCDTADTWLASGDWPQATTDVEISFFGERGQGAGPSRLTTRYQMKETGWKATVGKERIGTAQ
ncbi:hypothetical protein CGCF413_v012444 [Colletotrichum fructicola]|nr:hypothetical protein CGCF413_v012444 [Colletotrichum fructicola]